jgi:O-antigen/teichoic acid export membrane protein
MKVALPLMPLGIIGIFSVIIDRKLITHYHGLSELASYNLTLQLLLPIQMLMSSVQTVWAPHLFSIEDSLNAYNKTLYTMKIALVVMIFGAISIWIVVKVALFYEIISLEYVNVLNIMIYASLGMIAMALSQLCNNMFVYLNKTSFQLYVAIFVVGILFIMSYILIPGYSSVGAALSVSTSYFMGLILSIYIIRRFCILNSKNPND